MKREEVRDTGLNNLNSAAYRQVLSGHWARQAERVHGIVGQAIGFKVIIFRFLSNF